MLCIYIWLDGVHWSWSVTEMDNSTMDGTVAYGCTPDYHQACECARIAWEQHSKGEE